MALTSIAASNSSLLIRRRSSFLTTLAIIGTSHFVAYVVQGEVIFASFTALWCVLNSKTDGSIEEEGRDGRHPASQTKLQDISPATEGFPPKEGKRGRDESRLVSHHFSRGTSCIRLAD